MESKNKLAKELKVCMQNVGLRLKPDILQKCVSTCRKMGVDASRMAESWEVYSLNRKVLSLDENTFGPFEEYFVTVDLKVAGAEEEDDDGGVETTVMSARGIKRTRPVSESDDDGKDEEEEEEMDTRENSTSKYSERTDVGTVVGSYNPQEFPPTLDSKSAETLSSAPQNLCRVELHGRNNVDGSFRYMHSSLHKRALALDRRLNRMKDVFAAELEEKFDGGLTKSNKDGNEADGIDLEDSKERLGVVGVPSQEEVTVVGRICHENPCETSGRLDRTSVLLEGPRNENGIRVSLDLDKTASSLFPGQIVAARAVNATGRTMVVSSMNHGTVLPPATTPIKELHRLYGSLADKKGPLTLMVACGPYTADENLKYEPLTDLLMMRVKTHRPDVLILMGPFVDMRQPRIKSGRIGVEIADDRGESKVMPASYETFFLAKITYALEELLDTCPDLQTQFVVVPSLDDAVAEPVFPQPPLADRPMFGGGALNLPNANELEPGLLGLESVVDQQGRRRVHAVPNPCTLKIDEVTIGLTSTDGFLHLSSQLTETRPSDTDLAKGNQNNNRMDRIGSHFLRQRSFYPLFPSPDETVPLDLGRMQEWEMDGCTPDVLILPSKLMPFARRVDESSPCVVVNPGHLTKCNSGGTFASMAVQPMDAKLLDGNTDGAEHDETAERTHDVHKRIRVDIVKI